MSARHLSALAHVEFDIRNGRWAVAPTTLTTLPGMPGRLLLCGQRPSGLLEHLRAVADQGYDVDVRAEPARQPQGPATLLLEGSAQDATAFADAGGIRFIAAAHRQIAQVLPAGSLELLAEPATPDPRFPHCLVDPTTLVERWDEEVPEGTDGLWAWPTFTNRRARYVRRNGSWWLMPDLAWAQYLAERPPDTDPLCRHEPAHRLLIVDSAAPLPAMHARAAVLCSGRLPLRQHLAEGIAEDHYVNVDDDTADRILSSLDWSAAGDNKFCAATHQQVTVERTR